MQTLILVAVVALAALYLGRRAWKAARGVVAPDDGCGAGCGCSGPAATAKRERPAAR
jgi:hypothetical protein